MISKRLVYVPVIKPNTPKTIKNKFLHNFQFHFPKLFQKTAVSIRAGATSPKNDKQSEPNKEINSSKFGIATANPTVKIKKNDQVLMLIINTLLNYIFSF